MTTAPRRFELTLLPERFAISQLTTHAVIPEWATQGSLFSVARTSDELSVVCEHSRVPAGVRSQPGWSVLKLRGPFALTEICVLSALASTLAEAKLSLFTMSAFNTDYPGRCFRKCFSGHQRARKGGT
jgi:hypothetical protein